MSVKWVTKRRSLRILGHLSHSVRITWSNIYTKFKSQKKGSNRLFTSCNLTSLTNWKLQIIKNLKHKKEILRHQRPLNLFLTMTQVLTMLAKDTFHLGFESGQSIFGPSTKTIKMFRKAS